MNYDLTQEQDGYYAYLNFKTLNTLLKNIEKRRETKNLVFNLNVSNKENQGCMDLSNF